LLQGLKKKMKNGIASVQAKNSKLAPVDFTSRHKQHYITQLTRYKYKVMFLNVYEIYLIIRSTLLRVWKIWLMWEQSRYMRV
jgi:hypothetical protein